MVFCVDYRLDNATKYLIEHYADDSVAEKHIEIYRKGIEE